MEEKDKDGASAEKIQKLREMIYNAEKTLQGAKSMLLQLEGNKRPIRKRRTVGEDEEGTIIEGTFDGQLMIGPDGKQYPVPANYASKSKLVEGDSLKLTITSDGSFVYKQIGPAERKKLIGTVTQDAEGNYVIIAEGKPYRVLLASITYFKVESGDEVALIVPKDIESDWGAVENVIRKAEGTGSYHSDSHDFNEETSQPVSSKSKKKKDLSIIDEWTPDLEELKKELNNTDL